MGLVIFIIAVIVVIAVVIQMNKAGRRTAMRKRLALIPGFRPTRQHYSADARTGIAVDEGSRRICLMACQAAPRVVAFTDVAGAEIEQDGCSVTTTSRTSQLGGALAGGLLFGGLGAVVGGLSGARGTRQKVRRIDLRVLINDLASPVHVVNFLDIETKSDSLIYRQAFQAASEWHALLNVILRQQQASRELPSVRRSFIPSQSPPAPPQLPHGETCANCGRSIGKLEPTYAYKGHVVCKECDRRLNEP
jgi:hypothetical protein